MLAHRRIAVVGSREFKNWAQLKRTLDSIIEDDDELVSGGAVGADSMAQRYAKEYGYDISIKYPKYSKFGKPATFIRNKLIAENADIVLAFYRSGHFQEGGTANTIEWAKKLGRKYFEFEEETAHGIGGYQGSTGIEDTPASVAGTVGAISE